MSARPIIKGVQHVGIHAKDPALLAQFYRDVLGMQIVGQSGINADDIRSSVFLTSRREEKHYQLAIYAAQEISHIAFQVDSLADLRAFYRLIVARNLPIRWVLNHVISLAFYFSDPAGNLIKLYWPTGVAYPQPHGHPIDLTQSETALRQDIAALVAQFKPAL